MSININASPNVEARFTEAARKNGINPDQLFEQLVIDNLPELNKNAQNEEEDFGGKTLGEVYGHLFGTVHSGVSDKAGNPKKYMSGFGQTKKSRDVSK